MALLITRKEYLGRAECPTGTIKAYRKNPGDPNAAIAAAAHYAQRDGTEMLIVQHVSYMRRCYSIVRADGSKDDIKRLLPMYDGAELTVYTVDTEGLTHKSTVEEI